MNHSTRRQTLQGMAALLTLPLATTGVQASHGALTWQALRTDAQDFFRAPVLLTGSAEAILVDGSFNYAQGRKLVEAIKATGKRLSTIYLSSSDPDYYFSLAPVKAAFPEARVLAASETIAAIRQNVAKKIAVWGPKLGSNGPQKLDEVVFATPFDEPTLDLEGQRIDIVTSKLLKNRRYLWVPSLSAAIGGVYVFSGLHLWTADAPTPENRQHWLREVESLIARTPSIVVAGHAAMGANNGIESLHFTRDYLVAYEQEVQRASHSAELIAAMKQRFPGLGLEIGLEIGAKVAKGEMSWG